MAISALLAASVAAWSNEPSPHAAPAKDARGKKAKSEASGHGKEKSEGSEHGKEPPAPPRVGCFYDPNAPAHLSVHPEGDAKPEHSAAEAHGSAPHAAAAKPEHGAPEAVADAKTAPTAPTGRAEAEHAAADAHDASAKGEHAAPEVKGDTSAASEAHAPEARPEHAADAHSAEADPARTVPAAAAGHANSATPIDEAPRYPAVPDTESAPPAPIEATPAEATHPRSAADEHDAAPPAEAHSEPPAPTSPAVAQNDPDQPYALIRTLEAVQDNIVTGSRDSHVYQRKLIAEIARKLPQVTDEQWKQPRNSRAAIVYALSGGDPGVLAKLLSLSPVPCIDENLIRGLLDYSQGRNTEALELLSKIDARTLDPRAGGHLALAQALLVAAEDPKRAMGYLDQARLLAPGTLVEEAALRREAVIAAISGDLETFRRLTSQYLRRYNKSFYSTDFIRRFATAVTTGKYAESPALFQSLVETLDQLALDQRKLAYSAIAEAGVVRGQIQLTLLAAKKLADHAKDDAKRGLQARLYEAAALLVTDDYERAAAQLKSIDRTQLGARDQPLLDAALALSMRLRAAPAPVALGEPPAVSAEQGRSAELSKLPDVVDKAKKAFGKIDELLDGDKR
jgi:chemotaxis protein MotC